MTVFECRSQTRWVVSSSQYVKVNSDTSYKGENQRSVSGILRHVAALQALNLARDLGFSNIMLEGDSLSTITKLRTKEDDT
ncbi:hypothetical protein Golax_000623 [Gossypium laxum]|uniref:RNase H type-1 domain-containing protein n=1 Tax=Gossypium laxum TaxID=34288 RepID=A0A7J9AW78_9ROSI|nr:hypothetical protein [Gossypium laxum]